MLSSSLLLSPLLISYQVLCTEAYRDSPQSSLPCDPTSPSTDNAIAFAGSDPVELPKYKELFPDDGYLDWAELHSARYDNTVYISSTADVCQGVGFHWTVDTDENESRISIAAAFYIGEKASYSNDGGGFGAIGFSETGGMRGADVVYFTFEDSDTPLAGKLVDAHILDSLTVPIPDEHQDWELIEQRITHDGYLIFEVTRDLVTSDPFDRQFVNDSSSFVEDHKIIAAWNRSPMEGHVMYHGQNRARASIQLFKSDDSDVVPGLDYHGFRKEMDDRSDKSIDLRLTFLSIPLVETYYHEECFSTADMITNGLFNNNSTPVNIIGYEFLVHPETFKYMHHMVFYGHYAADSECSRIYRSPIFVWTPGNDFLYFPRNTGFILGGSDGFKSFTMQYHIDNKDLDSDKIDMGSGIRLYTTVSETIDIEVGMMQIGDPFVQLFGESVGRGLTKHEFECPSTCTQENFNVDKITVIKESLHMHFFGKRITNQLIRNDELIHEGFIDYWDFDQSGTPAPQQNPFEVRKGDVFRTVCYYDTPNDTNITFGSGSSDEVSK